MHLLNKNRFNVIIKLKKEDLSEVVTQEDILAINLQIDIKNKSRMEIPFGFYTP